MTTLPTTYLEAIGNRLASLATSFDVTDGQSFGDGDKEMVLGFCQAIDARDLARYLNVATAQITYDGTATDGTHLYTVDAYNDDSINYFFS